MKLTHYIYLLSLILTFSCSHKEGTHSDPLHTIVIGNVLDSISKNPISNLKVTISMAKKFGKDFGQGYKGLYTCLTDSFGYYKFDVNFVPDNDFDYSVGTWGNSFYDAGAEHIILGTTNNINLVLNKY